MEKQTKHIYAKCPKCGHWCDTIPADSWGEKFSLSENMVDQDLDVAVSAEKTKLKKFGMKTFGEVFHFPMTFIYRHHDKDKDIGFFECQCGNQWTSLAANDKYTKECHKAIEINSKIVPLESVYQSLKDCFNLCVPDTSDYHTLKTTYEKLLNILLERFCEIPTYARRFLWVTDELINYYPKNFVLLNIHNAYNTNTRFEYGLMANQLYIKHPYKEIYYPCDKYCQAMLEDEVDEFINVMACLGAKHLSLKAIDGKLLKTSTETDINSSLSANAEGVDTKVFGNYSEKEKKEYSQIIERIDNHTFKADGRKRYYPPKGMYAWYDFKDSWHRKAELVMEHSDYNIEFTVSTKEEMLISKSVSDSISIELKEMRKAQGANISDEEFKKSFALDFKHNTLSVDVEFYTRDEMSSK